jgi:hypothetical protein
LASQNQNEIASPPLLTMKSSPVQLVKVTMYPYRMLQLSRIESP